MPKILIIARELVKVRGLNTELSREGFTCIVAEDTSDMLDDVIKQQGVDLVLVDLDGSPASTLTESSRDQIQEVKLGGQLPIIVIISKDMVNGIESTQDVDDFVVEPCDLSELVIRIKRTLKKTGKIGGGEIIKCGDLLVDTAKCEVYLEGRLVSLTFKEYELLKFLTTNKGRVFSRGALLNAVWGYDYYGGDRTVDVHVRRLRSKIEDSNHTFIDTVRNIGYIFKEFNWSPSLETCNISNSDTAISNMANS